MPSGGHARSGRVPDPGSLRSAGRDAATWTHLSAKREGDAPAWPLSRASKRELTVWIDEWRRPQATMWEARGQEREVALYVRALITAEDPEASPPARRLVLTFMDDLGITQGGLARNRWIIDTQEPVAARLAPTGTEAPSAKRRLELLRD